jgi:hypothetical protein
MKRQNIIYATTQPLRRHLRGFILVACAVAGITSNLTAQGFAALMSNESSLMVGSWSGTRTENNPITGRPFTINFEFEFRSDGSYTQRAGFGRAVILDVQGTYSLRRGSKAGDPSFTHILNLVPLTAARTPSAEEVNSLQVADLPNIAETQQYVSFYNLAPAGAATLKDVRPGAESWGLQRH